MDFGLCQVANSKDGLEYEDGLDGCQIAQIRKFTFEAHFSSFNRIR